MNWEKPGSAGLANIQKFYSSISSMNWEILNSSARATFNNPDFKSLYELRKTWKYSPKPIFQF